MRKIVVAVVVALALAAGGVYWWSGRPLHLSHPVVDLQVHTGDGPDEISRAAVAGGVQVSPEVLKWWLRLGSRTTGFKAGPYEVRRGDSLRSLLRRLMRGEFAMRKVRLGEGWNFRQVRAALAAADALRHDTAAMSDADLMKALDRPDVRPEGMFFPDTYKYVKHTSDLDIHKLSLHAMDRKVDDAWQGRKADLPLQTPYDLLKLASIVEKETGHSADRSMVAAVFVNRLRKGMRLQTDPSVIYGMGTAYEGTLRKEDLTRDTPYNTYTRAGLPPTPISLPSEASLEAAAHPADSSALYFVSRGDGTSEFSDSLHQHNQAVNKYIRGKN